MSLNSLHALIAFALASVLASQPAQAMSVSSQGIGQVLLFPYYTVKNGFDTLLTLTNTGETTVVARVRFREALNGREVAALNVVLPPHDVWTAAATKDASGNGAVLRTFDRTCTSPALVAGTIAGSKELPFSNVQFTDTPPYSNDKATMSMTRVQEGYFEVISMGEFNAGDESFAVRIVPYAAQHVNGTPRDCDRVANSVAADYADLHPARDVLRGNATYINVANGIAFDAMATAIEGFSDAIGPIWSPPDSPHPDLADGDPAEAAIYSHNGIDYTDPITTHSADTISALLMATAVINEFASDGVGALTEWVLTYPTKRHYTDGVSPAVAPFSQSFQDAGKSCDPIYAAHFNREARQPSPPGSCFNICFDAFFQSTLYGYPGYLCTATNVMAFNGSKVFAAPEDVASTSTNIFVNTFAVGSAGWVAIKPVGKGSINGNPVSVGAAGLPVIGFSATVRINAAQAGNNRNYGSATPHNFFR